jgi:hypothetical protein
MAALWPVRGAQHDRLAHEIDVTADPEIRQDHIAHPPSAVDQMVARRTPIPKGSVHTVHFYDGFLLIRQ